MPAKLLHENEALAGLLDFKVINSIIDATTSTCTTLIADKQLSGALVAKAIKSITNSEFGGSYEEWQVGKDLCII